MANNQYVNRVDYGNDTLIDISDTTAEEEDVLVGQTFYTRSGAPATGTLGDATTSTHGLMSVTDKTKLDGIATGANKPVYLAYGSSTWDEAKAAYDNGAQLYCLASSSIETPGTGDLRRIATLVYLGGAIGTDSSTINEFEFQYYRSQSTKTTTELCDQIVVYKLNHQDGWSCTMRYVAPKRITGSNGITTTYNNDTLTISASSMVGAISSTAGTTGMVPAPNAGDQDKFLKGDGTWAQSGLPMVILKYGISTWDDFINAYNNNVIVYCRASSNSDPSTGNQTRMAFMAYVNDGTAPTEVEFQYYRSISSHNNTQYCDQVFIYKLNKTSGWSVTTRHTGLKEIAAGTGISVNYSNNKATVSSTIPDPPTSDGIYTLQATVSDGTLTYSWIQSNI